MSPLTDAAEEGNVEAIKEILDKVCSGGMKILWTCKSFGEADSFNRPLIKLMSRMKVDSQV